MTSPQTNPSFSETAQKILEKYRVRSQEPGIYIDDDGILDTLQALEAAHNAEVQAARVEELTKAHRSHGEEYDNATDEHIDERLAELQGDTHE